MLATDTYHPAKFDKNHALDEFFLQYVYSDQLEDIADDFTEFWLGDDIYDGWNSPLKKMLQELDLTWYDAELPQGEMGRMYFREAEAVIDDFVQEPGMHYPERRQIKRKIDPGTMLISHDYYFINGYGSKPDTIAHVRRALTINVTVVGKDIHPPLFAGQEGQHPGLDCGEVGYHIFISEFWNEAGPD